MSAVAIAALIILLVAKEMVRAAGGDHAAARTAVLNVAIYPLLAVFAFVVGRRLLELLR
ncbi:MAG: hypothetical protein ACRDJF_10185 [Actinomycetota bacterium]